MVITSGKSILEKVFQKVWQEILLKHPEVKFVTRNGRRFHNRISSKRVFMICAQIVLISKNILMKTL